MRVAGVIMLALGLAGWLYLAQALMGDSGDGADGSMLGARDGPTSTATADAEETVVATATPTGSPTADGDGGGDAGDAGDGRAYTVQPGDTLARIATRFGVELSDLIEANQISDPSRIEVGQRIVIPGR